MVRVSEQQLRLERSICLFKQYPEEFERKLSQAVAIMAIQGCVAVLADRSRQESKEALE
jgi:hypothetical protein